MYEILNNLVIDFGVFKEVKKRFEDLGLSFDIIEDKNLCQINTDKSNIDFTTILLFLEEIQTLKSFKLEKTNDKYYIHIIEEK